MDEREQKQRNLASLPVSMILSILFDEYGVSDATWKHLLKWLDDEYPDKVSDAVKKVVGNPDRFALNLQALDSGDGRFYLKKDDRLAALEQTLNRMVFHA